MIKNISLALGFALALTLAFAPAQAATPLSGWAWSSNVGWISFSSTDTGTGDNGSGNSPHAYGVTVSTTTGNPSTGSFSGYAWSPNLGWISFQPADISGCPGATAVSADLSTAGNGVVSGWVRAIAGAGRTDGWDGCIKLADPAGSSIFPTGRSHNGTRGVTYHYENGKGLFKGFGWGSDVLGWVTFNTTLPVQVCSGAGCVQTPTETSSISIVAIENGVEVSDTSVNVNAPLGVEWRPVNATNCQTGNTGWNGLSNLSSIQSQIGTNTSGGATVQFSTTGTKYLGIICLDTEGSTISDVLTVNVVDVPPVGSLSCIQPANSNKCNSLQSTQVPNDGSSRTVLYANSSSCLTPSDPPYCQFYCSTGYKLRGGQCVRATASED